MIMQGVEDEQKELSVGLHSKKLAIAYGFHTTSWKMLKMSKESLVAC